MTKPAFSRLRQKIEPKAFTKPNDGFVACFYDDAKFKEFRNHRLLSIDGSIMGIPKQQIIDIILDTIITKIKNSRSGQ